MSGITTLEQVLRRDRAVVAVALTFLTILCWVYLVDMAVAMSAMPSMEEGLPMTQIASWTVGYFAMMFMMWVIMMIGMMVPSVAPMVLIYTGFVRKRAGAATYFLTSFFLSGYLVVWTAFSLVATLLQCLLDEVALLSPMMVSTSPWLGAGLLAAAGIYQMTPWKSACLAHCRSPIQFIMQHWRSGRWGGFVMGLKHGWYCLGCCWALMGLLFFGGVMNLVWIGIIAIFVLLEKVIPRGELAGKISGLGMIAVAVVVLVMG